MMRFYLHYNYLTSLGFLTEFGMMVSFTEPLLTAYSVLQRILGLQRGKSHSSAFVFSANG